MDNKEKLEELIKTPIELGEHRLPPTNFPFPYVEYYRGNVNHKHNTWRKVICNLVLRIFGYKIVSIFKDDINNIIDYKIRKI